VKRVLLAALLLAGAETVDGDYMALVEEDSLYIGKSHASPISNESSEAAEHNTVKNVHSPPDPCLDPESAEFVFGDCLGPVVCAGATTVSTTGLTDLELWNLRANTNRHGRLSGAQVNFCGSGSDAGGSSDVSLAELVQQQWQQTRLPQPVISLEPADGLTLVNLGTYMQAEQRDFTTTMTLLGQDVFLRAKPVMWHWDYGDGTQIVSRDHPGSYYPDSDGWHAYLEPGFYTAQVTIEWQGEFSTDNSEWSPIYGTGKTTSSAGIEVIEHRPRLEALRTS